MRNDYERVKCFLDIDGRKGYSLLDSKWDTMGKSCVELAYYNDNKNIMSLFVLTDDLLLYDTTLPTPIIDFMSDVQDDICRGRITNKRKMIEIYKNTREIPLDIITQSFPECFGDTRLLKLKARQLLHSSYHSSSLSS